MMRMNRNVGNRVYFRVLFELLISEGYNSSIKNCVASETMRPYSCLGRNAEGIGFGINIGFQQGRVSEFMSPNPQGRAFIT